MASLFNLLSEALHGELDQLKAVGSQIILCAGERMGAFAGYSYYRFELPEDSFPRTTEQATFTFGTKDPFSVSGNVIEIDNQFLTIAFPRDFGPFIPEVQCSLQYELEYNPVFEILSSPQEKTQIVSALFKPDAAHNAHFAGFEQPRVGQNTPPDQLDAVRKIYDNKITMLWGPILSGKTHVLSLAAVNYLLMEKSVLIVAPSNDYADEIILKTVATGKAMGIEMEKLACRFDLPSIPSFDAIAPYSFEHQIEKIKAEKRKVFHERSSLLDTFWRIRIKQILHEDFYFRIQSLRNNLADMRRQVEEVERELSRLNMLIHENENPSLLRRVKRGFSKEELAEAQQKLSQEQKRMKQLHTLQQTGANDITTAELHAPVSAEEWKEYREAVKRLDELGGLESVTQSVDQFVLVNEKAILQTKQLIATSVTTALLDPNIRNRSYDMVIIEEAQRVNLPTLAALASLAKEKIVVAGDPFQVEPDSISNTEAAQQWLQTDIFLHVAQTKELNRLFDWSEDNKQWSIQGKSQFATTPKLSLFQASILFDDKINIFVSPQAKGKIYFIDTSDLRSQCKQYAGKKKISPFNEVHTKIALDCIKHALMESGRHAADIGLIFPFIGPTLYTKLQLRLQGMENIEVGTPQSFCDRRKPAIIFDTTMAGVDYTMRAIDDKKAGEHKIARLFNTVFSCVAEDIYVIADMSHFRAVYNDRLFTRILLLLQAEADVRQPVFENAARKFDGLDIENYEELFSLSKKRRKPAPVHTAVQPPKEDHELALQMKLMAAKKNEVQPVVHTPAVERDLYKGVLRVLGYRNDINLLSQFMGGGIVFKNSCSTDLAANKLLFNSCENEKNFRDAIDQLYLLIYEMAGGHQTDPSFFSGKGPEVRPRFDLRTLHAFFSSDIEAMMHDGKQKIAADAARLFQELVGKNQPGNPAEWSSAYRSILARTESYLSWISEQIRR